MVGIVNREPDGTGSSSACMTFLFKGFTSGCVMIFRLFRVTLALELLITGWNFYLMGYTWGHGTNFENTEKDVWTPQI